MLKITNKQYADLLLNIEGDLVEGTKVGTTQKSAKTPFSWSLLEVCETQQTAFKPHTIPGIVEVEDFDNGCPCDTYYDKDENNAGGHYRKEVGIDIEVCAAGGYNTGWASSGEWTAYTVEVKKTGTYKLSIYVATTSDSGKLHVEVEGNNITGSIAVPNTGGYQNWKPVSASIELKQGPQVIKLVLDEAN